MNDTVGLIPTLCGGGDGGPEETGNPCKRKGRKRDMERLQCHAECRARALLSTGDIPETYIRIRSINDWKAA